MSSAENNSKNWPRNIFILIPAYNSADDLNRFLPFLLSIVPVGNVCVIDDGSHDSTASICSEKGVDYQKQAVNRGKGAALRKGFRKRGSRGCAPVLEAKGENKSTGQRSGKPWS